MQIRFTPANRNNYEVGRGSEKISFIILHWSGNESLTETDTKFANSNRLASAHLAIDNFEIHQYVKDSDTAFHSGLALVDKQSIGIICIGGENMPVTEATYQTLAQVIEELARKYRIPIDSDHIKGHKDIVKVFCPGSLDISRVIVDAKALSPGSVMDKLKMKIDELQDALIIQKRQVDTADSRIEEVRLLLYKKDEAYQKKIEEFIYLEMRNEKLEEV